MTGRKGKEEKLKWKGKGFLHRDRLKKEKEGAVFTLFGRKKRGGRRI